MGSSPGEGTNRRMNQRRMYQNQSTPASGVAIAAPRRPQKKNEATRDHDDEDGADPDVEPRLGLVLAHLREAALGSSDVS